MSATKIFSLFLLVGLIAQGKNHINFRLHVDWLAIDHSRLIAPLLYRRDCRRSEQRVSRTNILNHYRAILPHHNVYRHRPLNPQLSRGLWVHRLHSVDELYWHGRATLTVRQYAHLVKGPVQSKLSIHKIGHPNGAIGANRQGYSGRALRYWIVRYLEPPASKEQQVKQPATLWLNQLSSKTN